MRYNEKRSFAALTLAFAAATAGAQQGEEPEVTQSAPAGGVPTVEQYDQILRENQGLRVYNALVQRQIDAQQTEIQNYQAALELVPELERQVPPLLIRMVQGLDEFVQRDMPFLAEERAERVAELQLLIERSDVNDAEKFRRIIEAWQIETEYGSAYVTYPGELTIDGTARPVDFLQVGRVGLLYQTTDEEALTGAWDAANGAWVSLGSEYRNSVRQALRMASNQIAPELVLLPVPAPE
jgi:hypothetical protein